MFRSFVLEPSTLPLRLVASNLPSKSITVYTTDVVVVWVHGFGKRVVSGSVESWAASLCACPGGDVVDALGAIAAAIAVDGVACPAGDAVDVACAPGAAFDVACGGAAGKGSAPASGAGPLMMGGRRFSSLSMSSRLGVGASVMWPHSLCCRLLPLPIKFCGLRCWFDVDVEGEVNLGERTDFFSACRTSWLLVCSMQG